MADFKSYLESLVLLPKKTNEPNVDNFQIPFDLINFLYMVRDHFYKYQTVHFLFTTPTPEKLSKLGSLEYLKMVNDFAVLNKNFDLQGNSIAFKMKIPYKLQYFIFMVLMGYIKKDQNYPLNYFSDETDPQAVFKRVYLEGYDTQVLKNGSYVTERRANGLFEELNGTTVLSVDVMPTPAWVMNTINDVLRGAYKYYTTPTSTASFTASKNSWILTVVPTTRFRNYLDYFTSGKITLEYLKAIQVRDKILATDLGKDLSMFPAFLILKGDTSVDPYDSTFLRVDSISIKDGLAKVISYIENQLFAQDINLLSNISNRFKTAIDVNNASKAKLKEEQDKLALIDSQLKTQILEAKKIYTAYEVVMNNMANTPDPVVTYLNELEIKMNNELVSFESEQLTRLNTEAQLIKEQELRNQLALVQQTEQQRLVEQAKQAEIDRLAQEEKAKSQVANSSTMQTTDKTLEISYSTNVTPISVSDKATNLSPSEIGVSKKSSAVPLVAGAGLLALLFLGNKD